jgi:SAM-dependent methyltransferase
MHSDEVASLDLVSKARVADHGEVFTRDREVDAMLDMVRGESERIDSRFLEPACGTGNFLAPILRRKLGIVAERYAKNPAEYDTNAVVAAASVYGIDILRDNVEACRRRLTNLVLAERASRVADTPRDEWKRAISYVLERNIVWGDALTLQTVDGKPRSIVFVEWSLVGDSMVKRRDFTFYGLVHHEKQKETPLFSDSGDEAFIPRPSREYPIIPLWRLGDVAD